MLIQEGWTPLIAASFFGHVDVVAQLIDAHAYIDQQTKVKRAVLLCAIIVTLSIS